MHTKAPPPPKLIFNDDESTYTETEETEDPFNCFSVNAKEHPTQKLVKKIH